MSFGALRKAQKALAKVHADSESDEDEQSSYMSEPEEVAKPIPRADKGKDKEEDRRDRKEVPKRKHKHALVTQLHDKVHYL